MLAIDTNFSLDLDDIIFSIQKYGGISEYWRELGARLKLNSAIKINNISGNKLSRLLKVNSESEIFHSSYFRLSKNPATKNVTTVYDMAYEMGYLGGGPFAKLVQLERKRAYFGSDALICISNSTREDLLNIYPQLTTRCPIYVVHLGININSSNFVDIVSNIKISKFQYILYVGGRDYYKNFTNSLIAYAESGLHSQGIDLICSGKPLTSKELALINKLNISDSVKSLGILSRSQLDYLYAYAYCLLYPSIFEGFGLPLLEAMKNGCPIISSIFTSIPEVVGDAGILVDTKDPANISEALKNIGNFNIRNSLITNGSKRVLNFTWDITYNKHIDVYKNLL